MSGIEFARPEALASLAVAIPVVVAHLYRKRRRRVAVTFVPLLREALGPTRARGAWRRLAEGARLVARVLAVAAIGVALAGPRPAGAVARPVDLAVVVDGDVTMSALEREGPRGTRRHVALDVAAAWVAAEASGGEARVAAVLAGPTPRVLVAPTTDREAARRALREADDLEPSAPSGWEPAGVLRGDLVGAVAAARAMASPARDLKVVVVTSRAGDELASSVGDRDGGADDARGAVRLAWAGVGAATDDRGFVEASVRRHEDGATFTVRLVVRNAADRPFAGALTWRFSDAEGAAGAPFAETPIDVPARGEATVERAVVAPKAGGDLVVTLPRDAWDANDAFAARLERWRKPSVLVVHGGVPRSFVRALLEAMGDDLDVEASGFVAAGSAGSARPRDVTVVDGAVAAPAQAGPRVYIAPFLRDGLSGGASAPDPRPFRVGARVDEPVVWRADTSHPLLRGVDLSTAWVARADGVEATDGTSAESDAAFEVLASVEGVPVLVCGGPPEARWVALGLDPDGSDLPLRAALPLLLRNAVRWTYVAPAAPLPAFVRGGEALVSRTGEAVEGHDVRPVSRHGEGARPLGGASFGTVRAAGTGRVVGRTARVLLDRALDVTPARAVAAVPPPSPATSDAAAAWLRRLAVAAGGLLLLDLLLGADLGALFGARLGATVRRAHGKSVG